MEFKSIQVCAIYSIYLEIALNSTHVHSLQVPGLVVSASLPLT